MKKNILAVVLTVMMLVMGFGLAAPAAFAQADEDGPLTVVKEVIDTVEYGDGDDIIEVNEPWWFMVQITVTNNGTSTVSNIVVKDKFGADLEVFSLFSPTGTWSCSNHGGKADQPRITWNLGDLAASATTYMNVWAYTDTDPGGNQRYTSPCEHELNSGATAKGTYEGHKTSASSDPITVDVYYDLEGVWEGTITQTSPTVEEPEDLWIWISGQDLDDGHCDLVGAAVIDFWVYDLDGEYECDGDVEIELNGIDLVGTVSPDGQTISGTWSDGVNSGTFSVTRD
jgi:hypothetical protein